MFVQIPCIVVQVYIVFITKFLCKQVAKQRVHPVDVASVLQAPGSRWAREEMILLFSRVCVCVCALCVFCSVLGDGS
jgi:hypothetical protein